VWAHDKGWAGPGVRPGCKEAVLPVRWQLITAQMPCSPCCQGLGYRVRHPPLNAAENNHYQSMVDHSATETGPHISLTRCCTCYQPRTREQHTACVESCCPALHTRHVCAQGQVATTDHKEDAAWLHQYLASMVEHKEVDLDAASSTSPGGNTVLRFPS
jgi:hypothetical protein